jgi:pyridoxal phosphate enzyme (YggS family)
MDPFVSQIQQNIANVQERIQVAAQSVNRSVEHVRLVVVTKAQPVEVVRAAIEAGARTLGENYPEETLPKIQALGRPDGVQWHMIGHLQSRKASIVAEHFDLLQSLDSLRLAEKLERLLVESGRRLPVLLEMNVSGEESKYGWPAWEEAQWSNLLPDIEAILALPHLTLHGLMTMPPLYEDPEQTRPFFAWLRKLNDFLAGRFGMQHFSELSMGTSADFTAAVQEGATLVRIGTAIVGTRPKKG